MQMMNSKRVSPYVWALPLSLCLGVIGYPSFSAQAAEPPKAAAPPKAVAPPKVVAPPKAAVPPKIVEPPRGAAGQQKGVEKPPATAEKAVGQAAPRPMTGELTGKVTGVDPAAKTFTVMVQGRAVTFSAARLSKVPTVGENIDMAFTENPGGPPMATSSTASSAAAGARGVKKPYQHCGNKDVPGGYHDPLYTLNVCTF
jgi:hypothetical protein